MAKNAAPKDDNRAADGKVRFASKYPNLRVCIDKPTCETMPGNRYRWVGGKSILFERGTYATSDPAEIAALRAAKGYGRLFQELSAEQLAKSA